MVQTVWKVLPPPSLRGGVPNEAEAISSLGLLRHPALSGGTPRNDVSELLSQILANRGIQTPEEIENFLHPSREKLLNPFAMKGMQAAVERIQRAHLQGEKVLVHGDYDVDGITGTAIASLALSKLGIAHETFLPERKRDGYGVSEEAIRKAARDGVRLLVTVDCGISAREEIQSARQAGIDALVLDHHQLPAEGLPPAHAILNPLQEDCEYPFKELSAGGLAFKLAQALLGVEAFDYFDLATLSTVADLAPLRGENRIIVKEGLRQLSDRKRTGIRALAEVAGLRSKEIKTSHVGFALGPRINASGRMSSPATALRLLLTENEREAASLARILEEENRRRQKEERRTVTEAVSEVERTVNFSRDRVLVVAREGWHAGVIGIVAARLVERYHRPAFVIALESGKGKGSGRSIRSFHLFKALEAAREHLDEFGGHEQAAGFNLKEDQVLPLRKKLNEHSHAAYSSEVFLKSIPIDLEISFSELTSQFLCELELLEPFGLGNPKPVFLTRGLGVRNTAPGRGNSSRPQIWVTDGSLTYEIAVTERSGVSFDFEAGTRFDLVYNVTRKIWQGEEKIVLEVKDAKPV